LPLIGLAVALAVGLALAPLAAEAQWSTKIPRVGYLVLAPLTERPSPERAALLTGAADRVRTGGQSQNRQGARHHGPAVHPATVRPGDRVIARRPFILYPLVDLYRQAASYVDRILRGAKPNELPVQGPIKFQLVVNLRTASAIGVTIPQSLLLRVDEVIE